MSEKTLYSSEQILRAYKLIEVLAGNEFEPLSNKAICDATGWSPITTMRQLEAAQVAGFVDRTPDNRYRLAPKKMSNIAVQVQDGINEARSRFDDEAKHYTRSMY